MNENWYWWISSWFEDYDFNAQRAFPRRAFCKACRRVVDDWYPRPLEACVEGVRRAVEIQCDAPVVHADLWKQLAPHCPTAVCGHVREKIGTNENSTSAWTTVLFPPTEMIHVRGSVDPDTQVPIAQRVCKTCGRQLYFAAFDPHLVRAQVPKDRPVFMDRTGKLIVAEHLAKALDWSSFDDLRYERLPVRARPSDGMRLQGDPDWSLVEV
jgi:hypothetical protein